MLRYKQAIVVRGDLEMSQGKLAAQVAHAAVSATERARKEKSEWHREWLNEGQKKVVLAAKNEKELKKLYAEALKNGLPCELIEDAGLTELPPGTLTALGIGPAPVEKIDLVTGRLPLL